MTILVNLLGSTLLLASTFALVNMGFVLLYRTTGVPNFAQGQFVMLGGLVAATVISRMGYVLGALIAVLVIGVLGLFLYQAVMRFLLGADEFTKVIVTFLVAIIVNQFVIMTWGTSTRKITQPMDARLSLGGGTIPVMVLVAMLAAILLIGGLVLFLNRTVTGNRMQALAGNEVLSVYAGIRVHRLASVAWAVSLGIAGLAGVLYSQRADIGLDTAEIGLLAFPAAVIGGLSSIGGVLLGAVLLAATQTTLNYYLGGSYALVLVYLVMLAVLIWRPQGLMGRTVERRL